MRRAMTLVGTWKCTMSLRAFFVFSSATGKNDKEQRLMDNYREQAPFPAQGLYDPRFEHENCGIGAVVNMKG